MDKKLVVVTGASRGLGAEISKKLVGSGYLVVGIARSFEENPIEGDFYPVTLDLSELDAIPKLVREVLDDFGTPYALINNAASGLDGLLATQSNEDILHTITTNLASPILLTKYFSRHMLEQRCGRIVNISSVVATTGYSGLSVYAASKSGLLGFTRSLSRELGRRNITVNAIQPGFMHTAMTKGLKNESLEKVIRRSALGSLAEPEDVASLVDFLLSSAGDRITGASFVVDAGNSA
jgi:3-oxoacyl-[acyl-carrier protein] reductase